MPKNWQQLAKAHGIARWTTDLDAALKNKDDTLFFDAATTVAARRAAEEGDRRPARTSIARSRSPKCSKMRSISRAPPRRPASSTAWCRTSCSCPACSSSRCCSTPDSSDACSRCAASSAIGCSRATWQPAQAAVLELQEEGRRRHHPRHALPLALRARQSVRRGRERLVPRRHAHPQALGRERQALQGGRRRRRLRDVPTRERR